jgi:hypothetical protein
MTVCFAPYIHDPTGDAFELPHLGREDQEDFELGVCNANAVDLLLALGLDPSANGGVMAIGAFSSLVTAALRRHLGCRSPELPTVEDAQPGQITMIHVGRREGYIERKLGALMLAIQRSRAIGASHFGWS